MDKTNQDQWERERERTEINKIKNEKNLQLIPQKYKGS